MSELMAKRAAKSSRKPVARFLAAMIMVGLYCLSTVAVSGIALTASTSAAQAQRGRGRGRGRGVWRGRGRGRGWGRGRGRGYWRGGVWVPWVAPGLCHVRWSSRWVSCL